MNRVMGGQRVVNWVCKETMGGKIEVMGHGEREKVQGTYLGNEAESEASGCSYQHWKDRSFLPTESLTEVNTCK